MKEMTYEGIAACYSPRRMPDRRRPGTRLYVPLWLVWAAAFSFVLIGLGSSGILDNNEGLYAEIPREMLASHDWRIWVIPHLNGLPYMEKPPLLYWLTALSFSLFGESEWSVRAVPALSSLACVAMLLWFGRAQGRPQVGRLAALMFASGIGVAAMSRVLMFDMLLTAMLTAALMCAYRFLTEGALRWVRWTYVFLALAVLAKGFVALVLFGLVVLIFMFGNMRSPSAFLRGCLGWFEPWGMLIFCAIAVPWHVAATLTEPIFAWFYFINEHVLRFLGLREPHDYHAGGWWYYLPRMAIYLFPWSFLLPCLLMGSRRKSHVDDARLRRFLLLAWLMPLIFFSASSAKANYYLVAVMPFAAFHLAYLFEKQDFQGARGDLARAVPGLVIAVLAAIASVAALLRAQDSHQTLLILGQPQREFVVLASGGLAVLGFACAALAWRSARVGVLSYVVLAAWSAGALIAVMLAAEPLISTRQLATYLQTEMPGRTIYLYRNFEQHSSLPFYRKQPLPVIDSHSSDLFWGNKLRPDNGIIISPDQFARRMQSQAVAVVVMTDQVREIERAPFFTRFTGEKKIGERIVFFN